MSKHVGDNNEMIPEWLNAMRQSAPESRDFNIVPLVVIAWICFTLGYIIEFEGEWRRLGYQMALFRDAIGAVSFLSFSVINLVATILHLWNLTRRSGKKNFLKPILLGIFLLCMVWFSGVLVINARHDLLVGPSYLEGIVRTKEMIGKTPQGMITVEGDPSGKHYVIRDMIWFETLQVGQKIEMIYGPWTKAAFPKNNP